MKKIILLIIYILTFNIYAQKKCGKVYYKIEGKYSTFFYEMTFNEKESYNVFIDNNESKNKQEVAYEEGKKTTKIILGKRSKEKIFFYNNINYFFFSSEYIDTDVDIIEEDKKKWKWKILTDKKMIGNFKCQKATVNFRGSFFTAWFTNEIPVPFGPWKAKDLPGLILQLSDSNNITKIIATKVTFNKKNKCKINLDKKILKKAISIKEFLKQTKIKDKEYFSRVNAKLPKGSKPFKLTTDCDDCPKEIKLENF
ncbi:GLPGLI family protein [Polaribacter sp. PL03]|uniref:GLPGLI family protein n=1 Tax=Polaribacter sp. PL03 TaxID=3088353 RepID=UPI0029D2B3AA|nr:GLPGLI family protein [Polaribacter sp. PL03]MDX6745301.1 GLPGLI family protein [Polaribacter sp. PL03]